MTDKKSRRVVIINNIDSDNIDQAIFILKSDPVKPAKFVDSNIAKEAQSIIDNYIRQVERIKVGYPSNISGKQRKTKSPTLLLLMLSALGIICVGLCATVFHILG